MRGDTLNDPDLHPRETVIKGEISPTFKLNKLPRRGLSIGDRVSHNEVT